MARYPVINFFKWLLPGIDSEGQKKGKKYKKFMEDIDRTTPEGQEISRIADILATKDKGEANSFLLQNRMRQFAPQQAPPDDIQVMEYLRKQLGMGGKEAADRRLNPKTYQDAQRGQMNPQQALMSGGVTGKTAEMFALLNTTDEGRDILNDYFNKTSKEREREQIIGLPPEQRATLDQFENTPDLTRNRNALLGMSGTQQSTIDQFENTPSGTREDTAYLERSPMEQALLQQRDKPAIEPTLSPGDIQMQKNAANAVSAARLKVEESVGSTEETIEFIRRIMDNPSLKNLYNRDTPWGQGWQTSIRGEERDLYNSIELVKGRITLKNLEHFKGQISDRDLELAQKDAQVINDPKSTVSAVITSLRDLKTRLQKGVDKIKSTARQSPSEYLQRFNR